MKQIEDTLELIKILEQLKHYTACTLGKQHIEALTHFESLEDLHQELKKTDEALRLVIAYGPLALGGLHDLTHPIKKAEMDGMLLPSELLDIAMQVDVTRSVLNYNQECELDVPYFKEACQVLVILK